MRNNNDNTSVHIYIYIYIYILSNVYIYIRLICVYILSAPDSHDPLRRMSGAASSVSWRARDGWRPRGGHRGREGERERDGERSYMRERKRQRERGRQLDVLMELLNLLTFRTCRLLKTFQRNLFCDLPFGDPLFWVSDLLADMLVPVEAHCTKETSGRLD